MPNENIQVLYIEENEASRLSVSTLLSESGYSVSQAENCLCGIEMAQQSVPELILMGMYTSSGLNGYEAATHLKMLEDLKDIPVIGLTDSPANGDRERSLIAGCDGYIPKPVNPDTFVEDVQDYLNGRRDVVPETEQLCLLREYSGKLVLHLEKKIRMVLEANKKLEQRVDKNKSELESVKGQLLQSEKLASIGQLAAGVAHEINNPVGFINSNLGTLQRYVKDMLELVSLYSNNEARISDDSVAEKIREFKQKIEFDYLKDDVNDLLNESMDGIGRVKKIIQDLKDFSRVDAFETEWSDLHHGIETTLNIVHNEIKYKADVIKEYGDLPEVECVPAQINQVFMNLLVNAAHAIKEHGTITISSGTEENDKVWIRISDTGTGISPENLNKLFEPFFTTKPIGQGTGLGLSLSYGIIQKHGGTIDVESVPGKGTAFTIHLPINNEIDAHEDVR